MEVELSDFAVEAVARLEADDPSSFELLSGDLAMLAGMSVDELDVWATLVGLTYYLGPTGRVRYWAVLERGRFVIELFDVDL